MELVEDMQFTLSLPQSPRSEWFWGGKKINAVDPGYTATDFNIHTGPGTVPDAASRVVKAATLGPDGPTGQFFSDDNVPETGISPWWKCSSLYNYFRLATMIIKTNDIGGVIYFLKGYVHVWPLLNFNNHSLLRATNYLIITTAGLTSPLANELSLKFAVACSNTKR